MQNTFFSSDVIRIKGARQHNLRNLDITIPKNRLVVITGPSGSGKSSLAFDTLFAEGQRRYVETLSAYARQFLDRLEKPDVDFIEGLSPAIAIGQHTASPHARSTVATITEIYDYLRLLFASIGVAHDPVSGEIIKRQSVQQIVDTILKLPSGTRIILLAPLMSMQNESYEEVVDRMRREGFVRMRIDGNIIGIDEREPFSFSKKKAYRLEVVVDRLMLGEGISQRLSDSLETALKWGKNRILHLAQLPESDLWEEHYFSTDFCNPKTGFTMPPLLAKNFSFNSLYGACPQCEGLGVLRDELTTHICSSCYGKRFRPEILAVTILGKEGGKNYEWNIHDFCELSIREAKQSLENIELTDVQRLIVQDILPEIKKRLQFLEEVGLGYLVLARESGTLSGGETQRIRLATQVGSALSGVLYVLDEPSIGLHPRDHACLLRTLHYLRDLGNSVIVVEHDEETMRAADHIIDMGPGAGIYGGQIIAQGRPEEIMSHTDCLTGSYLRGDKKIAVLTERRKPPTILAPSPGWITVQGARENNLKNLTVGFPVGLFTCVTGVSGSGKSTLVNKILHPAMTSSLNREKAILCHYDALRGYEHIDKVILVDQKPIGRTPRSNPATYIEIFGAIRDLFAALPAAKIRGYTSRYFSCNLKGGRCEHCLGDGMRRIEMNFLADVYVPCDVCEGRRFQREALEITFKGRNIAQVLEMSVQEAVVFFKTIPHIYLKLARLAEVGLGYLTLGQSATTLSGGEAQRLKLAFELGKRATGKTLYLLDEPTTGLHSADIQQLLEVLFKLRDLGNTIIVIEHHVGVMKAADWIIDLGPEGGEGGGYVVAQGTPETVAACSESVTGLFLK